MGPKKGEASMDKKEHKLVVTGVSQITINKKWVGIIVSILLVAIVGIGWMFKIVATARPVSAEYAKQHPLR
jgi:hypothetical protein